MLNRYADLAAPVCWKLSPVTQATPTVLYTVRFAKAIYVLHAFQKKSKKGIATPKADIDLIKQRLRIAEEHYDQQYGKKG